MSVPSLRTVYGTLLNHRAEWDALAPAMDAPPYKGAPRAPVLYVKPANTWSGDGGAVALPPGAEVEVGATVAMVLGEDGRVAGWRLVNDWTLPHPNYFRPPVKAKCRDGFLGVSASTLPMAAAGPADFTLEVRINGEERQRVRFTDLVRPPNVLLDAVREFMAFAPGDALMLGLAHDRPRAKAGDVVEIRGGLLGSITQRLVPEAA